jgi:hypothetical protein
MTALRRLISVIVVLAGVAGVSEAAPQLTPIRDRLYRADGGTFLGVVIIRWNAFTAADGTHIPANVIAVPVTNGVFKADLVPTTNASDGALYFVEVNAQGKVQYSEKWAVPPSSTPLTVRQVRIEGSTSSGGAAPVVQMTDVIGLTEALAARPVKGAGYTAGRAAVIDAQSNITAAPGSPTDCVRADGTTGPCGSGPSIAFVDMETPGGVVNGVNLVFTLSQAPNPASSLHLYRNGVLQKPAVDYVLAGNSVAFLEASTPQVGDTLTASFRVAAP